MTPHDDSHICICDDCNPAPYEDRCKFEAERDRLREALESIARKDACGDCATYAREVLDRLR